MAFEKLRGMNALKIFMAVMSSARHAVESVRDRLATKCQPAGDRDQVAADSWHDRKMTTDEFLTSGSCLQSFFYNSPRI